MNQINPQLPTVGGSTNTWGVENNAVHRAVIGSLNDHDAQLAVLPETIRDTVGATLRAGASLALTVDDAADTITLSLSLAATAARDPLTGWYRAESFGVLPSNNGATNSTNLQTLLNAIPTAFGGNVIGGTVVFPEGRYYFASTVLVPRGVTLRGSGGARVGTEGYWDSPGTSFIADTSGMTILALNSTANGATLQQLGPRVESINFYGKQAGYNGCGIYAPNVNRWTVRDCGFKWLSTGLEADSTATIHSGADCSWWMIDNCTWVENGVGLKLTSGSGVVQGGDMVNNTIGIDVAGTSAPLRVLGTKFDLGAGAIGIRARSYNSTYFGTYFELTDTAIGVQVAADPAISYSGADNTFVAPGFFGHSATSVAMQIASTARRTRIVAPVLGTATGYQIQDAGGSTATIIVGA